jgi:hypothetical protein
VQSPCQEVVDKWFPCQDGIGGLPSGGDGARLPTGHQPSTSKPGRHLLRRRELKEEWAPRVGPEAVSQQPVRFHEKLVDAILCHKGDDQHWPGD